MHARLIAAALAVALTVSANSSSATPCVTRAYGCTCADVGGVPGLIRGFAKGAFDQSYVKHGTFLRASLVRVLEVDSLGQPMPDSLRALSERTAAGL